MFQAVLSQIIPNGSWEEVYFVVFSILIIKASWILDMTQFYNSGTLESDHALCELWQQLVQDFGGEIVWSCLNKLFLDIEIWAI